MTMASDLKLVNIPVWHALHVDDVLTKIGSSKSGLTSGEAAKRLKTSGGNTLRAPVRINSLKILINQFKSILIWILIAAGVSSWFLGEKIDAVAILAIVFLNATIGLYQEFKAEKSIAALKNTTAPKANVRRDGTVISIDASKVVVGDVLELEAGAIIAADARLIKTAYLKCIESTLTGESKAVKKLNTTLAQTDLALADTANMVFMGTSVVAGTGSAVVIAIGMKTELGIMAGLITNTASNSKTPLQIKLNSVGHFLMWTTLSIVSLLFGLGLYRGMNPIDLFMSSVSLAVAGVPEGLPAIVTVALALGVSRMARRGALVRKLPAVETLGSTSVICTDKTGTLTVGDMTVRALYIADQQYIVTGEGYGSEGDIQIDGEKTTAVQDFGLCELAKIHVLCNNSSLIQEGVIWKTLGDPTEGALLTLAKKAGLNQGSLIETNPQQYEFPFDSNRKRSSVVRYSKNGKLRVYLNGAPGVVLERCTHLYTLTGSRPLTSYDREHILEHTASMANKGLRVIASANRVLVEEINVDPNADAFERNLTFVGLTGMYDPPRPSAKIAIEKCKLAGIRVIMITGDHPKTALAIAKDLGITAEEQAVVSGVDLDRLSDANLKDRVKTVSVYARVTAGHKLRIVRALKAYDAVVAMTGDGVNDAPAIKGADIGIAMGKSGTDVTKQAADMIITDDDFSTIVLAVQEGRGIYENIRKTLQYLLAGNTGELLLMMSCIIAGLPTPLLPIHLLWINLITDGLPAMCLVTDPIDCDLMKRKPRAKTENILNRRFLMTTFFIGILTAGASFTVYFYALKTSSILVAQTSAFSVVIFAELLRSFGARSETKPIWRLSFFSNRNLIVVVCSSLAFQIWSQHNQILGNFLKTSKISYSDGLILLCFGTIPLLGLELVKTIKMWRFAQPISNS
jgi:Ca2+-transporting ATPase